MKLVPCESPDHAECMVNVPYPYCVPLTSLIQQVKPSRLDGELLKGVKYMTPWVKAHLKILGIPGDQDWGHVGVPDTVVVSPEGPGPSPCSSDVYAYQIHV